MKRRFASLIVGLVIGSIPLIVNGQVSLSVGNGQFSFSAGLGVQINSPSDFYQPLAEYGNWVDLPPYGRCWHPNGVSSDWEPYSNGQWVWTDAGWYWQSDEPYGWATCHYGSWVNNPTYGWCWIPGTEWAPAWVTWRQGDNYVGWAPCGPNQSVLGPQFFLFTGIHDFGRQFHGRRDFRVGDRDIIGRTHVMNDFSTRNVNINGYESRIRVNRGPALDTIQHATGRTFQARPVQDVAREHQPANMRENRQPEQRNRNEQPATREEQQRNEQQRAPRNEQAYPPSSQQTPRGYEHPGAQPPTPQQRQIEPTGREHGITTPPQQREVPNAEQPGRNERAVPPTGQEHGVSTPPQQREVPQPPQPGRTERAVPPTGQEHGVSLPPQQHELQTPGQPNKNERAVPPAGQEHGTSFPQQRESAPTQPAAREQSAPRQQEKAPEPQQRQQENKDKDQRNP